MAATHTWIDRNIRSGYEKRDDHRCDTENDNFGPHERVCNICGMKIVCSEWPEVSISQNDPSYREYENEMCICEPGPSFFNCDRN